MSLFSINQIYLAGNVSKDPELRYTPNGHATVTFSVATNRSQQNKQTQAWDNIATFHRVVVWGKIAENIAQGLKKGMPVTVQGRQENRSYQDQAGITKYISEVVAEKVIFSAPKGQQTQQSVVTQPQQYQQPQTAQTAPPQNNNFPPQQSQMPMSGEDAANFMQNQFGGGNDTELPY